MPASKTLLEDEDCMREFESLVNNPCWLHSNSSEGFSNSLKFNGDSWIADSSLEP